jgi:hypothetical protein
MTKVHLVFPHGTPISFPNAVGRHLGSRLSSSYEVFYYDIQEPGFIKPGNNDVLVGHAWPTMSLFRRSCRQLGWKRIILLQPYCHGDNQDVFVEKFIDRCDLFLAITGKYWFDDIVNSNFKHWLPKMRHVDLAIDRKDFPTIKRKFNSPGKRKFVYIGSNKEYKNTNYLSELAMQLPEIEIAWIGNYNAIARVKPLARMDFASLQARNDLIQYDFMLTVGKADGNPTTILESMGWGLIPVCTPQSGYIGYPGIPNIPLGRAKDAAAILNELQFMDEKKLFEMQKWNWELLDTHFNWERFTANVIEAIESADSPHCLPVSKIHRSSLLIKSYYSLRLDSWPLIRQIGKKIKNYKNKLFLL